MNNVHTITVVSKLLGTHNILVDCSDNALLAPYSWGVVKRDSRLYARARVMGKHVLMHRFILGLKDSKLVVDHKDGNGLNNTRNNIRACTHSQNAMNIGSRKGSRSRFKGVFWMASRNRWIVWIRSYGVRNYGGVFESEELAALAYNELAMKHHGEFAKLNRI